MPAVKEFARAVEEIAPRELAEDWDNVGTLVDCGGDVTSVLVALDITDEVVLEADAKGCGLIVAHHPVIFHPLRSISRNDVVYKLIKKGISAICAHSNLDAAAGGVNDLLAAIFGVVDPVPFANVGRIGRLKAPVTAGEIAQICASRFSAHVRMVDAGRPVNTLAVLGGSGGSLVEAALAVGADCLLTGEADHHDAIDAAAGGLSLVLAGHFSTEFPIVPVLADRLATRFPDVKVRASRRNKDPFAYLEPISKT